MEPGELPGAALARELREELGIDIAVPSGPPMQEVRADTFHMQIWLIEAWTGSPANVAPDEHDAIAWFTEDALGELPLAHDSYPAMFSKVFADMDQRLAAIIDELLQIVQAHPQDLNWQPYYDDHHALLHDLHDHAERIRNGDPSRLPELKFSLLPTGDLNEIAFSSGWGAAYVRLADEFDELYTGPATPPSKPNR